MARRYPTSINGTATTGGTMYPCTINTSINFISNDSTTYDLLINFDKTIAEAGAIVVKAGESISDLNGVALDRIYVQGVGGSVAFRLVGV